MSPWKFSLLSSSAFPSSSSCLSSCWHRRRVFARWFDQFFVSMFGLALWSLGGHSLYLEVFRWFPWCQAGSASSRPWAGPVCPFLLEPSSLWPRLCSAKGWSCWLSCQVKSPPWSLSTSRPVHARGILSQNCLCGTDINKYHHWKLALHLVDLPNPDISSATNINNYPWSLCWVLVRYQ